MKNRNNKKKSIKNIEENEDNNNQVSNENAIYTKEVKISIKNIKTIIFSFPKEFPFSNELNSIILKLNQAFLKATAIKRERENVQIPKLLKILLISCVLLFIAFLIISITMNSGHTKVYISFSILGTISILLFVLTIANYSYSEGKNEMYSDILTRLFKEEIKKINNELEREILTKGKIHFLFDQDEQVIKVRYYGKNTRRGGKSISILDPIMLEQFNSNNNNKNNEDKMIELSVIAPSDNASTISLEKNNEQKELLKTEKKKKKKKVKCKEIKKDELEKDNNNTFLQDDTHLNLNNENNK